MTGRKSYFAVNSVVQLYGPDRDENGRITFNGSFKLRRFIRIADTQDGDIAPDEWYAMDQVGDEHGGRLEIPVPCVRKIAPL